LVNQKRNHQHWPLHLQDNLCAADPLGTFSHGVCHLLCVACPGV